MGLNGIAGDDRRYSARFTDRYHIIKFEARSSSFCGLGYYDSLSNRLWHTLIRRKPHLQNDLRSSAAGSQPLSSGPVAEAKRSRLIAISKTHPASVVSRLVELGATDLGENRVQEAEGKIYRGRTRQCRWHLVGHLQANKARRAVNLFDVIHSLDSIDLAQRLDRLCIEEGRDKFSVLIQVDLGHEETKSGIEETELEQLVESFRPLSGSSLSD